MLRAGKKYVNIFRNKKTLIPAFGAATVNPMKRFQSLLSSLIAILFVLSAAVYPSAEKEAVRDRAGEPRQTAEEPLLSEEAGGAAETPVTSIQPTDRDTHDEACDDACDGSPCEDARAASAENGAVPVYEVVTAQPAAGLPAAREPLSDPLPAVKKNRASSSADTMLALRFGEDYSAILTSADERHIYTFRVDERGVLRYAVSHGEQYGFMGWEATLYREYYLNGVNGEVGYRPLNVLKTTALNQKETSPGIGIIPGDYRIVITAVSGVSADEYSLNATFTASADHEIECNDTKAAYTELYTDVPMIGSASCYADRQDDDWFLLRIRKDGKARIAFSHDTTDSVSVAWRVTLYNDSGAELFVCNSGLNAAVIDSGELGLRAGVYYIAVRCRTRCDSDYTLTVTASADESFEKEDNDSFETADALPLGGMISGCVTAKGGNLDRDYYRFEMNKRGNFSLVFTHAPDTLKTDKNGWRVRLLTASGEVMYSLISTWNDSANRMPILGLDQGVYYVEICSEDMYRSNVTYTLIAGQNESSGFEMEPNNALQTANPIANGVPITGTIVNAADPDDDYYSFTADVYGRVTVELKHETTGSGRDIFCFSVCDANGEKAPLYDGKDPRTDENGNYVYFVSSLADQPNAVGCYELPPGTYYIKVTSGRFFDSVNYTLTCYCN